MRSRTCLPAPQTDVAELTVKAERRNPQRKHSLINLAHLPWAGKHAASVDEEAQTVHGAMVGDLQLGAELVGAIEGVAQREGTFRRCRLWKYRKVSAQRGPRTGCPTPWWQWRSASRSGRLGWLIEGLYLRRHDAPAADSWPCP